MVVGRIISWTFSHNFLIERAAGAAVPSFLPGLTPTLFSSSSACRSRDRKTALHSVFYLPSSLALFVRALGVNTEGCIRVLSAGGSCGLWWKKRNPFVFSFPFCSWSGCLVWFSTCLTVSHFLCEWIREVWVSMHDHCPETKSQWYCGKVEITCAFTMFTFPFHSKRMFRPKALQWHESPWQDSNITFIHVSCAK